MAKSVPMNHFIYSFEVKNRSQAKELHKAVSGTEAHMNMMNFYEHGYFEYTNKYVKKGNKNFAIYYIIPTKDKGLIELGKIGMGTTTRLFNGLLRNIAIDWGEMAEKEYKRLFGGYNKKEA